MRRTASTALLAALFLMSAIPTAAAAHPAILSSEFVFESAPFPSCHASTIVETTSGSLVAAWFGGLHEKAPDVGIWLSRLQKGQWTPPVEVATGIQPDGSRLPCWNPVLFQPADGPLMLFYKVGPDVPRWWGLLRTSTDGALNWSEPRRLPDGILGPIKNKPVQLADGAILCPTSVESPAPENIWRVRFERTADLGRTWHQVAPPPAPEGREPNAIQPSILLHGGDRLQAVGRTREGRVFETWSADAGATWSPLTLTGLPNPNAGTDALTLRDGRQLIVYNHTSRGRSPLNVALSRDGKSWHPVLELENEPNAEFSYPACIQSRDGLVHITYTWKRQRIRHVVLDPAKLPMPE